MNCSLFFNPKRRERNTKFVFHQFQMFPSLICFYLLFYTSIYSSEVEDCDDNYCTEPLENEEPIGPLFEGDLLGFNNLDELLNPNDNNSDSTQDLALKEESKRWRGGIVYYKISESFSCNEKCIIHEAMYELERKTCLTFVEDDQREDFIEILPQTFCASYVGRQGIKQQIYLTRECATSIGKVIHEIMHAVGFFHEQSRKDRNDYVNVNWDNIDRIDYVNFVNHGLGNVTAYDLPYDYDSLMHYSANSFARNKEVPTITAKNNQTIGQREKMSELDVVRINLHYKCTKKEVSCTDKSIICEYSRNIAKCCFYFYFAIQCPKTCGFCQSDIPDQRNTDHYECQTADDRCSKFTWWLNGRQCPLDNELKKIVKSTCFKSCIYCRVYNY